MITDRNLGLTSQSESTTYEAKITETSNLIGQYYDIIIC